MRRRTVCSCVFVRACAAAGAVCAGVVPRPVRLAGGRGRRRAWRGGCAREVFVWCENLIYSIPVQYWRCTPVLRVWRCMVASCRSGKQRGPWSVRRVTRASAPRSGFRVGLLTTIHYTHECAREITGKNNRCIRGLCANHTIFVGRCHGVTGLRLSILRFCLSSRHSAVRRSRSPEQPA